MLKLPATVRLHDVPALWQSWQAILQVEAHQLCNAASVQLKISAAELQDFDSAVLTLLLSASRLCRQEGVQMQVCHVPLQLRELARVYGVAEILWPELVEARAD
ncbi:STAS domain-containing protein [Roseateles koreensis]|uniref:STAS domain-containing protein n=1 Tax=Roseateles koreensis TaxID=2987526 RepID=A0ABT5KRL9_9BURK|nr:STAS domain-containing protein [Roseateles koreensis]MDC8785502.1 STAS domain-containing protein [Roseateles koreensis]